MDLLIVGREGAGVPATAAEVTDPVDARRVLAGLPHGPHVVQLVQRQAVAALVLAASLERAAARAAIGAAMQRTRPRGVILLGAELGRELLGEGLALAGGIRELHSKPIAAFGRAKAPEIERIMGELCQRAGIPWAPPGTRAVAASAVLRAEDAEAQAARLIEQGQFAQAADLLRGSEPLGPRGTNMLGRALLQLGDRAGARHAFERTLAADPGNSIAQRSLAGLGVEAPRPGAATAVASVGGGRASAGAAGARRPPVVAEQVEVVVAEEGRVTYRTRAHTHADGCIGVPREVRAQLGLSGSSRVKVLVKDAAGQTIYSGEQVIKSTDEITDPEHMAWRIRAGQPIEVTLTRR